MNEANGETVKPTVLQRVEEELTLRSIFPGTEPPVSPVAKLLIDVETLMAMIPLIKATKALEQKIKESTEESST